MRWPLRSDLPGLAELQHQAEQLAERSKEIAGRLSVSPEAIKKRVASIFRKLGVGEGREAVVVALARGILTKRP